MTTTAGRALTWFPRILGILFALFLGMFALDVFDGQYGPWGTAGALLLHLTPTFMVVAALMVAWKWPRPGALLFAALAALYLAVTWGRFPFMNYLIIGGPPVLMSLLFLANPGRA